jgi:hypothetical protein
MERIAPSPPPVDTSLTAHSSQKRQSLTFLIHMLARMEPQENLSTQLNILTEVGLRSKALALTKATRC